jgi:hypothetical protein
MRRDAQAVLLFALSAGLMKLVLTGTVNRFVGAAMVVPLVLAAALMAALGVATLLRSLRSAHARQSGPDVPARPAWLLLAPLVLALVVIPPPLGVDHASRYGTALARHAPAEFGPLGEGDPVRLTVVEYAARAVVERGRSLSVAGWRCPDSWSPERTVTRTWSGWSSSVARRTPGRSRWGSPATCRRN